MSNPRIVSILSGSAAERAALQVGDEIASIDGRRPRDIIAYRLLVDGPDPALEIERGGLVTEVVVAKAEGEPLGAEIHSAVFDRIHTCDNHCEFCFIYQLPPGMRASLSLKDDDYRLSFLYGNFTTLTRFSELDLERVVDEGISPLHVSIHATDPQVRSEMLRNRRGAMSLRWLRALLDHGVEVHGQVVVCPGVNDADVLEDTLAGVLDRFSELASCCVVPLGVSRHSREARLRPHTQGEAARVLEIITAWQQIFLDRLGRRLVFAADEYYLLAGWDFPPAEEYEGFPMHEDGVGMARSFERELRGEGPVRTSVAGGFFAAVDGAPAEGYRARRTHSDLRALPEQPGRSRVNLLTAPLGAEVLRRIIPDVFDHDVRVIEVPNRFFGGNVAVTGLMVGADLAEVLSGAPGDQRYLLPDVCLSGGRFLDGLTPEDLPVSVEVVPTDGAALREALRSHLLEAVAAR